MPKVNGLTDKQQAFVREYLVDRNATQAAIRAGYSAKWASRQAAKLVVKSSVLAAIREAEAKITRKLEIKVEDVLRRYVIEATGAGPDTASSARVKANDALAKYLDLFGEAALRRQIDAAIGDLRKVLQKHLDSETLHRVLADLCADSAEKDGSGDAE